MPHLNEVAQNVLETTIGGTLAIIIISMVFGFIGRMAGKLSTALDKLSVAIQDQTKAMAAIEKVNAIHIEVIRGLSNDIEDVKLSCLKRNKA